MQIRALKARAALRYRVLIPVTRTACLSPSRYVRRGPWTPILKSLLEGSPWRAPTEGGEVSPQCGVAREGSFLPGARGLNGSIEPFTHRIFTEFRLFVCLAWGQGKGQRRRRLGCFPGRGRGGLRKARWRTVSPRREGVPSAQCPAVWPSVLSTLLFE